MNKVKFVKVDNKKREVKIFFEDGEVRDYDFCCFEED